MKSFRRIRRSTVADKSLPGRSHIGGPAKMHNPHISVLYIMRSQVLVQWDIYAVSGALTIGIE